MHCLYYHGAERPQHPFGLRAAWIHGDHFCLNRQDTGWGRKHRGNVTSSKSCKVRNGIQVSCIRVLCLTHGPALISVSSSFSGVPWKHCQGAWPVLSNHFVADPSAIRHMAPVQHAAAMVLCNQVTEASGGFKWARFNYPNYYAIIAPRPMSLLLWKVLSGFQCLQCGQDLSCTDPWHSGVSGQYWLRGKNSSFSVTNITGLRIILRLAEAIGSHSSHWARKAQVLSPFQLIMPISCRVFSSVDLVLHHLLI